MGGINCPPPPADSLGADLPKLKDDYTKKLAYYCKELFIVAEKFYAANVSIERAVLTRGDLNDSIKLIKQGNSSAKKALNYLGSVASLWSLIASSDCTDFVSQQESMQQISTKLVIAANRLEKLSGSDELQHRLWEQPEITQALSDLHRLIAASIVWQANFAKQSAYRTISS